MFEALGDHAKREGLYSSNGLISVGAVAHDTSQVWYFGNPAAVDFALDLDRKDHGRTVPFGPAA